MKFRTAEGYQDGKAYTVTLERVDQYADTPYEAEDKDALQPKLKFSWNGKHGKLTKTYSIPLDDKGEPVLRPNLGVTRCLVAHGFTWEQIASLELTVRDAKARKAYADWRAFPRFADHKADGFIPVDVTPVIDGEPVIGRDVIVTVALDSNGIASPKDIAPVPETD